MEFRSLNFFLPIETLPKTLQNETENRTASHPMCRKILFDFIYNSFFLFLEFKEHLKNKHISYNANAVTKYIANAVIHLYKCVAANANYVEK